MNVIKIKTAKEIAKSLKRTYWYEGSWSGTVFNSGEEIESIYKKLTNLRKGYSDSELKNILGNFEPWRYNFCNSCYKEKLEEMIHISTNDEGGEEIICKACLQKGLKLLEKKD